MANSPQLDYLSIYRSHDLSRPTIVAELAEVNALPRTEIQPAIRDRDGEAHTKEGTLGMGWHIIVTFQYVVVIRLVLLDEMIHDFLHIRTHIRVGVFIDTEGTRSMLHEEMEQAHLGKWAWEMRQYLLCNKMTTSALGSKRKFCLLYHSI